MHRSRQSDGSAQGQPGIPINLHPHTIALDSRCRTHRPSLQSDPIVQEQPGGLIPAEHTFPGQTLPSKLLRQGAQGLPGLQGHPSVFGFETQLEHLRVPSISARQVPPLQWVSVLQAHPRFRGILAEHCSQTPLTQIPSLHSESSVQLHNGGFLTTRQSLLVGVHCLLRQDPLAQSLGDLQGQYASLSLSIQKVHLQYLPCFAQVLKQSVLPHVQTHPSLPPALQRAEISHLCVVVSQYP